MKPYAHSLIIALLSIFLVAGSGFSLTLGSNITIFDDNTSNDNWHHGENIGSEDNEVEPGMQHGQKWDLEAFFLDGTMLSMVGGYDFRYGESNMMPGDIFIDIDNNAVFGDIDGSNNDGIRAVNNTFGYDYVVDFFHFDPPFPHHPRHHPRHRGGNTSYMRSTKTH